jgi:hypothetical protein
MIEIMGARGSHQRNTFVDTVQVVTIGPAPARSWMDYLWQWVSKICVRIAANITVSIVSCSIFLALTSTPSSMFPYQ